MIFGMLSLHFHNLNYAEATSPTATVHKSSRMPAGLPPGIFRTRECKTLLIIGATFVSSVEASRDTGSGLMLMTLASMQMWKEDSFRKLVP